MISFISRLYRSEKKFRNPLTRKAVKAHMKGQCGPGCSLCRVIKNNPFKDPIE